MRKSEAQSLAMAEMRKHGLILAGWRFKFDNAKMRLGEANYRYQTISLSAPLVTLNDETVVLDTIRHEIAHALVGSRHGHDATWRSMARSIGGSGRRQEPVTAVTIPQARYTLTCPKCSATVSRYRKTSARHACIACCNKYAGGRFSAEYELVWSENERVGA